MFTHMSPRQNSKCYSASKLRTHIWANIGYYNSGQQTTKAFKESPPQHFTEYYYNCHQQFCQKSENCKGQNLATEEQRILKNSLAVCWHSLDQREKCWALLLSILKRTGRKYQNDITLSSTPLPLQSSMHSCEHLYACSLSPELQHPWSCISSVDQLEGSSSSKPLTSP